MTSSRFLAILGTAVLATGAATAGAQAPGRMLFDSPRLAQAPELGDPPLAAPSDLAPQYSTGVEALDDPATFMPKRATELQIDIRPSEGDLPEPPASEYIGGAGARAELYRGEDRTFFWSASRMRRTPIYFDDPRTERFGLTANPLVQPGLSAARFYATFPALPVLMAIDPPCRVHYTLGEGRWSLGRLERYATPY